MNDRVGILVLGMHRSGTSALMGALKTAGVAVTRTPLQANDWNPKGYFESAPLNRVLDQLLAGANSWWHDWRQLDLRAVSPARYLELTERMKELVRNDFEGAPAFAIKDPRFCRMAPLAIEIVRSVDAQPAIVIPLRHPHAVCLSLNRRDAIPYDKAALIWLRHVIEAERATRDLPRVFTGMDDLIAAPGALLDRLAGRFGLRLDLNSAQAEERLAAFVDRTIVHHAANDLDVGKTGSTGQWYLPLWEMLGVAMAGRDEDLDHAALDALYARFDDAVRPFEGYFAQVERSLRTHEAALRKARQELEKTQRALGAAVTARAAPDGGPGSEAGPARLDDVARERLESLEAKMNVLQNRLDALERRDG